MVLVPVAPAPVGDPLAVLAINDRPRRSLTKWWCRPAISRSLRLNRPGRRASPATRLQPTPARMEADAAAPLPAPETPIADRFQATAGRRWGPVPGSALVGGARPMATPLRWSAAMAELREPRVPAARVRATLAQARVIPARRRPGTSGSGNATIAGTSERELAMASAQLRAVVPERPLEQAPARGELRRARPPSTARQREASTPWWCSRHRWINIRRAAACSADGPSIRYTFR